VPSLPARPRHGTPRTGITARLREGDPEHHGTYGSPHGRFSTGPGPSYSCEASSSVSWSRHEPRRVSDCRDLSSRPSADADGVRRRRSRCPKRSTDSGCSWEPVRSGSDAAHRDHRTQHLLPLRQRPRRHHRSRRPRPGKPGPPAQSDPAMRVRQWRLPRHRHRDVSLQRIGRAPRSRERAGRSAFETMHSACNDSALPETCVAAGRSSVAAPLSSCHQARTGTIRVRRCRPHRAPRRRRNPAPRDRPHRRH
jgi:hypothetical protein